MEKPEYFNICITVLEANDLPYSNISSLACTEVGNEKKFTKVVKNTSIPFYNEYFVFELYLNFSLLMSTFISFKVFVAGKLVRRLVGSITLEVATVWAQPDHQLKAWFALTIPSDASAQVKGNLNCEIVIKATDSLKSYPKISSWVIPKVLGNQRARYIIRIYDCIGLELKDTKKAPGISVKTSFAGSLGSTTNRLKAKKIEWDEEITFIELYPPLFQKITIYLYADDIELASKSLYLADISSSSAGSNLPTFGPSYIHLYVNEYVYFASILLEIEAQYVKLLKPGEANHTVMTWPIKSIKIEQIGEKVPYLCYGVLFDAIIKEKSLAQPHISINMSLGFSCPNTEKHKESGESTYVSDTPKYKARLGNSDFVYLPLYEKKPCVFVYSEWPDTYFRLTNSNIVDKVILQLKKVICLAQDLLNQGNENEARISLKECLKKVEAAHTIVSGQVLTNITSLDKERIKMLSNVLKTLSSINVKRYSVEDLITKFHSSITTLDNLCEDIQESLPSVIVTFKRGNKDICYSKLHPRQVFFSRTEFRRGDNCGKIITMPLLNSKHINIGRVDIWLWLGFKDQVSSCLQLLPPGHADITTIVSLPTMLTYTNDNVYTAVGYIFGGILTDRINSSGLCDPSVKIYFCNQSRETYAIMRTLAPLWKEIFSFAEVRLYPSPEYIKENPPVLSLELWDQSSSSLVGSTFVIPKVRFQEVSTTMEYELQWFKIDSKSQILASFEVIYLSNEFNIYDKPKKKGMSNLLPKVIEPRTVSYRIEIVFWGLRPINFKRLKGVFRLQAIIQWGTAEIKSNIVGRVASSPNFKHDLEIVKIEFPDIKSYTPPIVLQVISLSSYIGFDVDNNVDQYVCKLPTTDEWNNLTSHRTSALDRARGRRSTPVPEMPDLIPLMEIHSSRTSLVVESSFHRFIRKLLLPFSICKLFLRIFDYITFFRNKFERMSFEDLSEKEDYDWWYKYHSNKMIKYGGELEKQPQFCEFNDVLKNFTIKQQRAGKVIHIAKLKALISVYQWPVSEPKVTFQGQDPETGVLKHTVLSDRVKVLVRVYCIKAHNLHPCDVNGKSDPYIEIKTSSNTVSDKSNFIPGQLNPVFGKCFEITATFPFDSILAVRIMDWDRFSLHDLIGETLIDIENRFYSKFRATCGLSPVYMSIGPDKWRDIENPTTILEKLCNIYNLPLPNYLGKTVIIGSKEFVIDHASQSEDETQERLALLALRHWNEIPIIGRFLVPEHVETRSLFHRERPGIERGKLEMWIDLFDLSLGPVPPPVDISPRKPQEFELRVIIWNTEKVPLVDDSYFVGRKHCDIYVKGWLGDSDSTQSTDVHYTSVTGEGNFNWRFIFPFQFNQYEKKMVIFKKGKLELCETEYKIPPLLHLQVWDSDRFSPDDFIGSMVLNLNCMPRGAMTRRGCKVHKVLTPANSADIFKVKKLKGWWPFLQYGDGGAPKNAGFLEAEFRLLTMDEALASPAGLGRAGPAALTDPIRPDFRFRFWLAPFRIIIHYVCGVHKGKVLLFLLIVALVIFVLVAIYSVPLFLIKKAIGA